MANCLNKFIAFRATISGFTIILCGVVIEASENGLAVKRATGEVYHIQGSDVVSVGLEMIGDK
jgi:hypothetical protein